MLWEVIVRLNNIDWVTDDGIVEGYLSARASNTNFVLDIL